MQRPWVKWGHCIARKRRLNAPEAGIAERTGTWPHSRQADDLLLVPNVMVMGNLTRFAQSSGARRVSVAFSSSCWKSVASSSSDTILAGIA